MILEFLNGSHGKSVCSWLVRVGIVAQNLIPGLFLIGCSRSIGVSTLLPASLNIVTGLSHNPMPTAHRLVDRESLSMKF